MYIVNVGDDLVCYLYYVINGIWGNYLMNCSVILFGKLVLIVFVLVVCVVLGVCVSVLLVMFVLIVVVLVEKYSVVLFEFFFGMMEMLYEFIDFYQLIELCMIYNGIYGVSLFFQLEKLGYFVVLFYVKEFWCVIQIDFYDNVEFFYCMFVEQIQSLVKVDLDVLCLQVQKVYVECMVVLNEQCLQVFQYDLMY